MSALRLRLCCTTLNPAKPLMFAQVPIKRCSGSQAVTALLESLHVDIVKSQGKGVVHTRLLFLGDCSGICWSSQLVTGLLHKCEACTIAALKASEVVDEASEVKKLQNLC
jgi:hypothetical protein